VRNTLQDQYVDRDARKGVQLNVLVADDDAVARRLMERLLTQWGHEVVAAADGDRAYEQIEQRPELQVLLLDWMMPGLDGPEICRRVRAQQREHYVYILLITSRSGREDFLEGMSAGADDFVIKPVDPDELQVRLIAAQRVIGLKTDIETQERINHELRELDRMKSAFILLTSHELRSPLAVINGATELLRPHIDPDKRTARSLLDALTKSTQRLVDVVVRTLKVSHEGGYDQGLFAEETDLAALTKDVVEEACVFADRRGQKLRVTVDDGLPPVTLDRSKIADALLNLLMNAIKFSPDGETIGVNVCQPDAGNVRFEVIDRGVGVSETDKPHIFEMYFSTLDMLHHSSGSYEFGKRGLGLGLPIVKHFAELHGGTAGFESSEGNGSRFFFTIPLTGVPEPGGQEGPHNAAAGSAP